MGRPIISRPEGRKTLVGAPHARLPKLYQAEMVAGSTLTPGPWVEEIAIFLR